MTFELQPDDPAADSARTGLVTCPKCGFQQPGGDDCAGCGINFAKFHAVARRQNPATKGPSPKAPSSRASSPQTPSPGGAGRAGTVGVARPEPPSAPIRVALPIARRITRDVATSLGQLLRSGTNPVMGFRMIAGTARPAVARELEAVAVRLEAGDALSVALRAAPRLFRAGDRVIIETYSEVGEPADGFAAIAAQAEDAIGFRRLLIRHSGYPFFILVAHLIITPLPKLVLSGREAYLRTAGGHVLLLVLALLFVLYGVPAILRLTPLGDALKRLAWRLPWPATVWVAHARQVFHRTLSRNLDAGLELFRSLRGAAAATADPEVQARVDELLPKVQEVGFAEPAAAAGLVGRGELMLVVSGEKSGELANTLARVAERYAEVRQRGVRWIMMLLGAILAMAVVLMVTLSLMEAYQGITGTAERLMNGLELEGPLRDIKGLEGVDLNNLDIESLQNMDLESLQKLPGFNYDVEVPELRNMR